MMLLCLFAWGADAEGERLTDEFTRYAKDRKWTAVERTYRRLIAGHPDSLSNLIHHSASQAARQRGDLLIAAQRLLRCDPSGLALDTIADELENLRTQTGMVMFVGAELKPASMPFAPDLRQAVLQAQKQITEQGYYVGLLPVGTYKLDGTQVDIDAGFRWHDAWVE